MKEIYIYFPRKTYDAVRFNLKLAGYKVICHQEINESYRGIRGT